MPPEEVHHHGPGQRREGRPGVVADLRAQRLLGDDGEARAGLDGYTRESEDDAREDVDDDLLADGGDFARALGAAAEDDVSSQEARKEGIVGSWRARCFVLAGR